MTNQKEGYCLMIYRCPGGHTEILWNSRDEVTPFAIDCRKCPETAEHVAWDADLRVPDFKPPKGMRVFVDCTIEKARASRRAWVERYWNQTIGGCRMSDRWPTKEAAIEDLSRGDYEDFGGHAPTIEVVGEEGRAGR